MRIMENFNCIVEHVKSINCSVYEQVYKGVFIFVYQFKGPSSILSVVCLFCVTLSGLKTLCNCGFSRCSLGPDSKFINYQLQYISAR